MTSVAHLRVLLLTLQSTLLAGALTAIAGPLPPRGALGPPRGVKGLAVGSQLLSFSRECALTGERVDFEVVRRAADRSRTGCLISRRPPFLRPP